MYWIYWTVFITYWTPLVYAISTKIACAGSYPASIQSRATFGWRFAGGPIVARFYMLTGYV